MKLKTHEIVPTTPHRELGFFEDMDRLFDSFLNRGWMRPFHNPWAEWLGLEEGPEVRAPRIDVIDKEEEILVRAELPGMKREDVTLELVGEVLTIRGKQQWEEKTEEGEVLRAEISHRSFARTIALPQGVEAERVTAELKEGVLEVHLPKVEKTERKRIEIQG